MRMNYVSRFSFIVVSVLAINDPCYSSLELSGPSGFVINGLSHHLRQPEETDAPNEKNYGFGLNFDIVDSDNLYASTGFYNNTYSKVSFYSGLGFKKRFGYNNYIEAGVICGLVTGYEYAISPYAIPYVSFGSRNSGSINVMYGAHTAYTTEVIMVNFTIPIGD